MRHNFTRTAPRWIICWHFICAHVCIDLCMCMWWWVKVEILRHAMSYYVVFCFAMLTFMCVTERELKTERERCRQRSCVYTSLCVCACLWAIRGPSFGINTDLVRTRSHADLILVLMRQNVISEVLVKVKFMHELAEVRVRVGLYKWIKVITRIAAQKCASVC